MGDETAGPPETAGHHEVLVVGGGNAGVSLTARLLRDGAGDVALLEPRTQHRYRPLLNYVGSGEASTLDVERPTSEVVPPGSRWWRDAVRTVDPDARRVVTRGGLVLGYDTLVLCPGLEEDWDATPGLAEAYAAGWAGSTFVDSSAPLVWPALRDLAGGRVLFSMPPEPAPCAATALKPLTMAAEHWRSTGVLRDIEIHLVLPGQGPTGLPAVDRRLDEVLDSYGVRVHRDRRVVSLADRAARLGVAGDGSSPPESTELTDLTFAHVVPTYRAPRWIRDAGLAAETGPGVVPGLVGVDPETMRHPQHHEVWALGDAADLHTRPSGGGLRKQVDVLAHNLAASRKGGPLRRYDGYTVMPVTTGRHRLLLVEVDRDGRPTPTVPYPDLARPRRSTWAADRYGLPWTYWHRILRGKV